MCNFVRVVFSYCIYFTVLFQYVCLPSNKYFLYIYSTEELFYFPYLLTLKAQYNMQARELNLMCTLAEVQTLATELIHTPITQSFRISIYTNRYKGNHIKEAEVDSAYSMHGRDEKFCTKL